MPSLEDCNMQCYDMPGPDGSTSNVIFLEIFADGVDDTVNSFMFATKPTADRST